MSDDKETMSHPSFGMAGFNRVSGQTDLFAVDYPQSHYMTFTVCTGNVERRYGDEWFYEDKTVLEIAMSEVQFARMIASPNASRIPCTIVQRHTEGFKRMPPVPKHMGDAEKTKSEFEQRGKEMADNLKEAEEALRAMTQPGNNPTKQKIGEVLNLFSKVSKDLRRDLPFYIQQMQESVDRTTNNAKSEVEAFAQHVMVELGKEALGEKIRSGAVPIRIGGNAAPKALEHKPNQD